MAINPNFNLESDTPQVYQIRIAGQLGREWVDWFGGMAITYRKNGDTLLTGQVPDQAALFGVLRQVRDLGMPLVSVNRLKPRVKRQVNLFLSRGEKMNNNRITAVIVGILYIVGTVAGIASVVVAVPIVDAPDYLVQISANASRVILGALCVLTMGLALAMVPVLMYPILKKQNSVLALGYVVFRGALETVVYMAMAVSWLLLVSTSQAYVQAGASPAYDMQALGTLIVNAHDSMRSVLEIVFPLGALMFYYLLYRSRLIPRWLSGWGFIAAILWLAVGLLGMFDLIAPMSTPQLVLSAPIGLQEMVMAVWLIVKGFNSSAIAPESARIDAPQYQLAHNKV